MCACSIPDTISRRASKSAAASAPSASASVSVCKGCGRLWNNTELPILPQTGTALHPLCSHKFRYVSSLCKWHIATMLSSFQKGLCWQKFQTQWQRWTNQNNDSLINAAKVGLSWNWCPLHRLSHIAIHSTSQQKQDGGDEHRRS